MPVRKSLSASPRKSAVLPLNCPRRGPRMSRPFRFVAGPPRACALCGERFVRRQPNQRYCSRGHMLLARKGEERLLYGTDHKRQRTRWWRGRRNGDGGLFVAGLRRADRPVGGLGSRAFGWASGGVRSTLAVTGRRAVGECGSGEPRGAAFGRSLRGVLCGRAVLRACEIRWARARRRRPSGVSMSRGRPSTRARPGPQTRFPTRQRDP